MSGHTPGPWRIIGADGYALGIWGSEAQDVVSEKRGPMRQEDARLIAAAPELLEALKELVERRERAATDRPNYPEAKDGKDGRYARARAAIARAEGS